MAALLASQGAAGKVSGGGRLGPVAEFMRLQTRPSDRLEPLERELPRSHRHSCLCFYVWHESGRLCEVCGRSMLTKSFRLRLRRTAELKSSNRRPQYARFGPTTEKVCPLFLRFSCAPFLRLPAVRRAGVAERSDPMPAYVSRIGNSSRHRFNLRKGIPPTTANLEFILTALETVPGACQRLTT